MFCPNCGTQISDGDRFCPECGMAADNGSAPVSPPQYFEQQNPTSYRPVSLEPELPMNWFKVHANVILILTAIANIVGAIQSISGVQYITLGYTSAEQVYSFFPGLQATDIAAGIACLAYAVFCFYVRSHLLKFRKDAPKLVTILYAVGVAITLIGEIIYVAILSPYAYMSSGEWVAAFISDTYASILTSAVMIPVNIVYFKKRKHLFVN